MGDIFNSPAPIPIGLPMGPIGTIGIPSTNPLDTIGDIGGDILSDPLSIPGDLINGFEGMVEDEVEGTIAGVGAILDLNKEVFEVAEGLGEDIITGEIGNDFADFGNDIADFSVDSLDWMSDGSNWGAAGKTLGYGSLALITGNPSNAIDLWSNGDLYYGDTWDDIDEAKKKSKEN